MPVVALASSLHLVPATRCLTPLFARKLAPGAGPLKGPPNPVGSARKLAPEGGPSNGPPNPLAPLASSLRDSRGVQARVDALAREQLLVRADLDQAAAVEHGDPVGLADRRQAVRDH